MLGSSNCVCFGDKSSYSSAGVSMLSLQGTCLGHCSLRANICGVPSTLRPVVSTTIGGSCTTYAGETEAQIGSLPKITGRVAGPESWQHPDSEPVPSALACAITSPNAGQFDVASAAKC